MTWDQWVNICATIASAIAALGAFAAAVASTRAAREANQFAARIAAAESARVAEAKSGVARAVLGVLDDAVARLAGLASRFRAGVPLLPDTANKTATHIARRLREQAARDAVQELGSGILRDLEDCAEACDVLGILADSPTRASDPTFVADHANATAKKAHDAGDRVARLVPDEPRRSFANALEIAHEIGERAMYLYQRRKDASAGTPGPGQP